MAEVITNVEGVPFPLFRRGKVRDLFDLGDELLMVATDRISVFDVILPSAIPRKGEVLNKISRFWFQRLASIVPNHMSGSVLEDYFDDKGLITMLEPRSMIVKKTETLPFEDVIRGYLSGSAWEEYKSTGTIGGMPGPDGLAESQELPEPLFTPTTKGEVGEHDLSMSTEELAGLIGAELMDKVVGLSMQIYGEGAAYARSRGVIIADTKMEFGLRDGELMIIDELLTPDSSRFWPLSEYRPGRPQPSFDKQFVRDYVREVGWTDADDPPELPPGVVENTTGLYLELYSLITGETL